MLETKNPSINQKENVQLISLGIIKPNPDQPRKYFDEKTMNHLTESIKRNGVLQPIILRRNGEEFIIVAGERRFLAAKIAGLETIPALIREFRDNSEISLVENLLRENLNPIEEAEAVVELIQRNNYKDKDLVDILGKAKSTISEIKKLTDLPESIKRECRKSNDWSRSVLLEIARQPTQLKMLKLYERIKKQNLNKGQIRAITRDKEKNRDKIKIISEKIQTIDKSLEKITWNDYEDNQKAELIKNLGQLYEKLGYLIQNIQK